MIDVFTATEPSYLVEDMPDSKECSPHPHLNLSKTKLMSCFFLIPCLWL